MFCEKNRTRSHTCLEKTSITSSTRRLTNLQTMTDRYYHHYKGARRARFAIDFVANKVVITRVVNTSRTMFETSKHPYKITFNRLSFRSVYFAIASSETTLARAVMVGDSGVDFTVVFYDRSISTRRPADPRAVFSSTQVLHEYI